MDGTTPPTQAETRTAAFRLIRGRDTTIGQIVAFVATLDEAGFEATEKTAGYIDGLWIRCEALQAQSDDAVWDEANE
tara:strand:- start:835 stop:1065 length:231 start_codon:yes stop_codon:yes gene_type:complete